MYDFYFTFEEAFVKEATQLNFPFAGITFFLPPTSKKPYRVENLINKRIQSVTRTIMEQWWRARGLVPSGQTEYNGRWEKAKEWERRNPALPGRKDTRGGFISGAGLSFTQKARTGVRGRWDGRIRWVSERDGEEGAERKLVLRETLCSRHPPIYIIPFPAPSLFLYFVMPIYGFHAVSTFMRLAWKKRKRDAPPPLPSSLWRLRCFEFGGITRASVLWLENTWWE